MKCFICGKEIEAGQNRTIVIGEIKDETPSKEWTFEPIDGKHCHTVCLTEEVKAEIEGKIYKVKVLGEI